MSRTTRIPPTEITGPFGYVLKRFSRKAERWDQIDPNLNSYAHMAVAALVGCSFRLDLGYTPLMAWIGFANLVTRMNVAIGIESQGFSSACELPLADPSAGVGASA